MANNGLVRILTVNSKPGIDNPDFLLSTDGTSYVGRVKREMAVFFSYERDEFITLNALKRNRPDESFNAAYMDMRDRLHAGSGEIVRVVYYQNAEKMEKQSAASSEL